MKLKYLVKFVLSGIVVSNVVFMLFYVTPANRGLGV